MANFFSYVLSLISMFQWVDIIDILCLTVVFFCVYQFIKERRAGKLALGLSIVIVFCVIFKLLPLRSMQYIIDNIFRVGVILLAIIFQPELRSALEKVGDTSVQWAKNIKNIKGTNNHEHDHAMIEEISDAVFDLAKTKTGAIIVFERNTKLGDFILTGTIINAQISTFLIRNIFFNKAPLHDGAVIIRDNRLYSAGCFLPLSQKSNIAPDLGTRHRAAIGISENSDCVAIVVSEETGIVSIAYNGEIDRNFNRATMKKKLEEYLVKDKDSKRKDV